MSFMMVVSGGNAFWAAGEFFLAILQVATGPDWKQGWVAPSYLDSIIESMQPIWPLSLAQFSELFANTN